MALSWRLIVSAAVFLLFAQELAEQDLRVLWDTIPKPLITIGKKGIEVRKGAAKGCHHAVGMSNKLSGHALLVPS